MAALFPPLSRTATAPSASLQLRLLLVAGLAVTCAVAYVAAGVAPQVERQPDLERLLVGMGLIKATLVAVGAAVIFWRLAHPARRTVSWLYVAGLWLAAGASVLICQLALVPLAALAFHVGELAVLVALWQDRKPRGV